VQAAPVDDKLGRDLPSGEAVTNLGCFPVANRTFDEIYPKLGPE